MQSESIDCDFLRLDGYLFVPPGGNAGEIDRELEAAHRAGLTQVHKVKRAPIAAFDTGGALCFPRQAQFHIVKYLRGLAAAIEKNQGQIYTSTHAAAIIGGSPESREKLERQQQDLVATVQLEIDKLDVETDGTGWRTKVGREGPLETARGERAAHGASRRRLHLASRAGTPVRA